MPVPLKSIVCIVATFVPWHVEAKHEPETVCPVVILAALWIVAKLWQLSHVAPPARMAPGTPARVESWHSAQPFLWLYAIGRPEVPWQIACVQVCAAIVAELTIAMCVAAEWWFGSVAWQAALPVQSDMGATERA